LTFTLNVAHHKLKQAVLECGEAKYCHIQLHQGTKVKAHQPTLPVHNTVCGSLHAPN